MVAFLSAAWIEALDRAVVDAPAPGADLVVQYVVLERDADDPAGPGDTAEAIAYHLAARDGRWRVHAGRAAAATVTLTLDRPTAAEVARGRQSAQGAFMAGRLRIGGDPLALVRHRDDVAALDAALAAVRDRTEW